jgi:hypothetical protein
VFRNVGYQTPHAGEQPKRLHATFRTQRKLGIKNCCSPCISLHSNRFVFLMEAQLCSLCHPQLITEASNQYQASPCQIWTKCQWDRFSLSTLVFPSQYHSTNFPYTTAPHTCLPEGQEDKAWETLKKATLFRLCHSIGHTTIFLRVISFTFLMWTKSVAIFIAASRHST